METITGDIIKLAIAGQFDVIIQPCNCFCTMGSGPTKKGLAKGIKDTFPEAYAADCATIKGDIKKLGTFTFAEINRFAKPLVVVNAYTQYRYGVDKRHVDYDAVRRVMTAIQKQFSGRIIGYPKIGCGLAGGDWSIIEPIINTALAGERHSLVVQKSAPAIEQQTLGF
jgi:O-acetyl-ADP-ribose deacetylase (regulator of RNase III)